MDVIFENVGYSTDQLMLKATQEVDRRVRGGGGRERERERTTNVRRIKLNGHRYMATEQWQKKETNRKHPDCFHTFSPNFACC